MLSPYDYWQFWRNTDDRDVLKFLKMFTDLSLEEIDNEKDKNINELKIILANETTTMLHGKKAAKDSEQAAKEAFSGSSLGSNLPSISIKTKDLVKQMNVIELIILTKLETSKSEIRRLISGKAIKINDNLITDEKLIIKKNLFNSNYLKLSIGKKRHIKVKLS